MTLDLNYFQSLIIEYGLNIIWAIVIVIVGWWLAGLLSNMLRKNLTRTEVDPSVIGFLGNMAYWAILIFAILGALARVGVQTTSIIAVLGAASLAVGLALQGSLSNFAAGVLILLFKPYRIGDYVEIAGAAGTVKEIQIFNTVMETPDQKVVIVPNAQATGGNITNYTTKGTRRVDMVFAIGYDDDIRTAKQLLEEIITADERVFTDPPPTVAVLALADSSVNFAVRPFVKVEDYWPVLFDTTEKVKLEFDKAGISIPYPQREVHLYAQPN